MAAAQATLDAFPAMKCPAAGTHPGKPLRHPGRTAWAAVIVFSLFLFIYGRRPARPYDWDTLLPVPLRSALLAGRRHHLAADGVVDGPGRHPRRDPRGHATDPNRIMQSVSWGYVWIFRGTPVYVQLVFWGLFSTIYPRLDFGIPFVERFFTIRDRRVRRGRVLAGGHRTVAQRGRLHG